MVHTVNFVEVDFGVKFFKLFFACFEQNSYTGCELKNTCNA